MAVLPRAGDAGWLRRLLPMALGLPLLFWPFARTLWVAVDLLVSPDRSDDRRIGG